MVVLVTGGAGFIASHIVDILLSKGYEVIGTSRTLSKGDKIIKLFKKKYPDAKLTFEEVGDIAAPGAFDKLLKNHPEIKSVIHTATGIEFEVPPEQFKSAFLDAAVEGTLNILNSVNSYGKQIEKVIITGSAVSIVTFPLDKFPDRTFTSEDWNPLQWDQIGEDPFMAYIVSKIHAEKASIKFTKEKKPHFKIITVNPMYVFGPQVFDELAEKKLVNTTNNILISTLQKDSDDYKPSLNTFAADVRDVAKVHVLALENSKLPSGQRFLIGNQHIYDQDLIDLVNTKFPDIGYKTKGFKQDIKPPTNLDHKDIIDKLDPDYKFISVEKTLTDVVAQYVKVNGSL